MSKKIDLERALVLNVDVQRAFGEEAESEKLRGLRPTEKSEIDAASKISEAVHEAGGTVVVTKDWHNPVGAELPGGEIDRRSKDEFEIYGAHALAKTKDAEINRPLERTVQRLEKREGVSRTVIPVDEYDDTGRAGSSRIIEVHKNVYDVTKRKTLDGSNKAHQSFIDLLAKKQSEGIDTVIITGKIAEVCVRAAAESIRELFPKLRVVVVPEAISAMPAEIAKSVGLDSKEEVLGAFAKKGIASVSLERLLPSPNRIAQGVMGR
jgi:nicotinamidase-related amidase